MCAACTGALGSDVVGGSIELLRSTTRPTASAFARLPVEAVVVVLAVLLAGAVPETLAGGDVRAAGVPLVSSVAVVVVIAAAEAVVACGVPATALALDFELPTPLFTMLAPFRRKRDAVCKLLAYTCERVAQPSEQKLFRCETSYTWLSEQRGDRARGGKEESAGRRKSVEQ